VYVLQCRAHLLFHPLEAASHPQQLVLEVQDLLDAGEVEPDLGRQPLDQPQPLDVELRVEPRVAGGPLRPDEPLLLVDAQRLWVHADEIRGDADHVARAVVHQLNSFSRGLAFCALRRFSSASRSAFVSFFGTCTRSRASRSPRPLPFSFGAPRPLTRSSLPSLEPAGTFSETRPSGVGISTVAPRAASSNVTGTSSTRSSPRRS